MAACLIDYWTQFYDTVLKVRKDSSWSRYRPSYVTREEYLVKRGIHSKKRQLVFSVNVVFDSLFSSPAVVEIVTEGEVDAPQTTYIYYVLSPGIENYTMIDSVGLHRKYPRSVRRLKGVDLTDVEMDWGILEKARAMNMAVSYRHVGEDQVYDCMIVKIHQGTSTVDLECMGSTPRIFTGVSISDVRPYYNWEFMHKRKIVVNNVELFLIGDDQTNNTEHERYMMISTDGRQALYIEWGLLGRLVASGRIQFIPCVRPVKPDPYEMVRLVSRLGGGRFRIHRDGHLHDIFPGSVGRLLLVSVSGQGVVQVRPGQIDPLQLRVNIDRRCTLYGHFLPRGPSVIGAFDVGRELWCMVPPQSWDFPVYLRPCELAWLVLLRAFRFVGA